MAFFAASVEDELLDRTSASDKFFSEFQIVDDPEKGRCLITLKDRQCGDTLYIEKALLFSSCIEDVEMDNLSIISKVYGTLVMNELPDILEELASLDKIGCLDTARNLLQFVAYRYTVNYNAQDCVDGMNKDSLDKMHLAEQLFTGSEESLTECIRDIKTFQKMYPKVFNGSKGGNIEGMDTHYIASILAKLNNNQLELEEYDGSGLFVYTALCEHSCAPNASYSTNDDVLYMTAIQDIPANSRICIDYINGYYAPTNERLDILWSSYGFQCTCERCQGSDRVRAMACQQCKTEQQSLHGFHCVMSSSSDNADRNQDGQSMKVTACVLCAHEATPSEIVIFKQKEDSVVDDPPESYEQVMELIAEGILHESHHRIFQILEIFANEYISDAKRQAVFVERDAISETSYNEQISSIYSTAIAVMSHCCRLLDMVLPYIHPEKVIYADKLAQLHVCSGQIDAASAAYTSAYQVSLKANGQHSAISKALLSLSSNTPTTRKELLNHYAASTK